MGYAVDGTELAADDEGYLLEASPSEATVRAIAAVEGIEMTEDHWRVVRYLQEAFRETGHTPNFRQMLKELLAVDPRFDNSALYALFPMGPAKQAVRIAGLPKPFGKGGY